MSDTYYICKGCIRLFSTYRGVRYYINKSFALKIFCNLSSSTLTKKVPQHIYSSREFSEPGISIPDFVYSRTLREGVSFHRISLTYGRERISEISIKKSNGKVKSCRLYQVKRKRKKEDQLLTEFDEATQFSNLYFNSGFYKMSFLKKHTK